VFCQPKPALTWQPVDSSASASSYFFFLKNSSGFDLVAAFVSDWLVVAGFWPLNKLPTP
jgi:hypothetical protein